MNEKQAIIRNREVFFLVIKRLQDFKIFALIFEATNYQTDGHY